MSIDISKEYPEEYKKIKNLGYDTIEKRYIGPSFDTGFHSHPFTACMIILKGEILLNSSSENFLLKKGDFISVENHICHNEKIGLKGASFLYGKKLNENKDNLAILEDSLDSLYLGDNNKLISFVTKSPASYILYTTLYMQHYSEIWKSQEKILHCIPKIYASRSTIINLINDGIDRGFIKKSRTHSDKRAVYYELNDNLFFEIEAWVKNRKSKLINIFNRE